MLYAEAQYYNGEQQVSLDIINKVRDRANLEPLSLSSIDTQEKFIDVILKERRKEFCFENQRWSDLVRTDRAFDVMKEFLKRYNADGNLTSKNQYYYPIPQRVTDVTGLE
jgi:hypothetical protein